MIWILLIPLAFWALFGNREDGLFGDLSFNPTRDKSLRVAFLWWKRNPFHNLTWHVIGVVGWPFKRYGKYPKDVFSPISGWNYAVIIFLGFIPLPFISYWSVNLGKFYIGWRERGAFGITLEGKIQKAVLLVCIVYLIHHYFPNLKGLIKLLSVVYPT